MLSSKKGKDSNVLQESSINEKIFKADFENFVNNLLIKKQKLNKNIFINIFQKSKSKEEI